MFTYYSLEVLFKLSLLAQAVLIILTQVFLPTLFVKIFNLYTNSHTKQLTRHQKLEDNILEISYIFLSFLVFIPSGQVKTAKFSQRLLIILYLNFNSLVVPSVFHQYASLYQ